MTIEQLKAIRPRKDDFYSRRLYSWLKWFSEKRFDRCGLKTPPYLMPEAILSRLEVRQGKKREDVYLVIPLGSGFLGSRIGAIRRTWGRRQAYNYFADDIGKPVKNFWRDYIKKGTCFLNPEHQWLEGPEAWEHSVSSKTRTCRWCGLKQKLRSKTVKKTETWWEEVKNPLQSTRPKRPCSPRFNTSKP